MKRSKVFGKWPPPHDAFYLAAGVGAVAFVLSLLFLRSYAVAVGVNAMFATYLALVAWHLPRLTPQHLKRRAADADVPVTVIFFMMVAAVAVAITFLFLALNDRAGVDANAVLASAASVLLGWFTIHTLAALHYAHEYYEPGSRKGRTGERGAEISGGLAFPGDNEPSGVDFLYFSYVIGMTAQVADVAVTSTPMRRLVMTHGVVAFLFNTTIIAATVNVVVAMGGK